MTTAELCPGCGAAYQNPDSGLCDGCEEKALVARYQEETTQRIEARRAWWRERQRAHRERARLRPSEPADAETDPLELVEEALTHVAHLAALCRTASQRAELDEVTELIKRIGWGPDEIPEPIPINRAASTARAPEVDRHAIGARA